MTNLQQSAGIEIKQAHATFVKLCKLFSNGKRYNAPAKLLLVKSTTSTIGRFLYIYQLDQDLLKDYNNDIVKQYGAIHDEPTLNATFDELFTFVRRVRNKLSEML